MYECHVMPCTDVKIFLKLDIYLKYHYMWPSSRNFVTNINGNKKWYKIVFHTVTITECSGRTAYTSWRLISWFIVISVMEFVRVLSLLKANFIVWMSFLCLRILCLLRDRQPWYLFDVYDSFLSCVRVDLTTHGEWYEHANYTFTFLETN